MPATTIPIETAAGRPNAIMRKMLAKIGRKASVMSSAYFLRSSELMGVRSGSWILSGRTRMNHPAA